MSTRLCGLGTGMGQVCHHSPGENNQKAEKPRVLEWAAHKEPEITDHEEPVANAIVCLSRGLLAENRAWVTRAGR